MHIVLTELLIDVKERINKGSLSPVQVAEFMLRLEQYRYQYQIEIERHDFQYRVEVAENLNNKMTKSKSEALAQATKNYHKRQMYRIEADHIDKFISQLKYYQTGVEAEWINAR